MKEKDRLQALSPGAQLWLIPPLETSSWAKRIDWYLGFQIRRSGLHQTAQFSKELSAVIETHEVDMPISAPDLSALMIGSQSLLPNHQTVVIPIGQAAANPFTEWVAGGHKVWVGLGQPLTRLFLPEGLTASEFEKRWPKAAPVDTLEIVLDTATRPL